jgi:hypothetical protein
MNATPWMNVGNIVLGVRIHSKRSTYCRFSFVWNAQYKQIYRKIR